ncbi:GAF domain-containing protein [Haloferula sp.]|uniref:GAF domain-containing protein n=1 Tax=Haloferula sp. TaxID=2497595 RepID=UPI0032A0974D
MADRLESLLSDLDTKEGAIWLMDTSGEHLIPVFNSSPTLQSLVGVYRQPLNRGIISMVLATQSAVIERDVHKNPLHDNSVDRQLGIITVHMMAAPLYFAGESRGVISVVRLKPSEADEVGDLPPFEDHHLESLKESARNFGRWLDECLLDFTRGSSAP